MRRIYESNALKRDDEDPHAPSERDREFEPRAMRSVPSGLLSRTFLPFWLRYRGISVKIETQATEFPQGDAVPFRVTMKNSLPIAVTVPTRSPVLWNWYVDGAVEASRVPIERPSDEPRGFRFKRGECKQFTKRWRQLFKISEQEWERVSPGEYTIAAGINVEDAEEKGLYDETTIRIVP